MAMNVCLVGYYQALSRSGETHAERAATPRCRPVAPPASFGGGGYCHAAFLHASRRGEILEVFSGGGRSPGPQCTPDGGHRLHSGRQSVDQRAFGVTRLRKFRNVFAKFKLTIYIITYLTEVSQSRFIPYNLLRKELYRM